ncbi:MAG: serine hydrolase domain-containing protein [Bryobacteraceae bacterium]|nr:serine hydrolase domain-containing protein [Bryobacteraceae bacterium]
MRRELAVGCGAALLAAVGGLVGIRVVMSVGAGRVHSRADAVQSVRESEPVGKWAEAAKRARGLVAARMAAENVPGVSVAVGVDGDVVWAEGFGQADLDTGARVTPGTRFRMGSASAALTSAAVGVLVDEGRLRLDDEIQRHVPQFPKKQWQVTLRQLMSHTGGLAADGGDDGPLFRKRCEAAVEAVGHFAGDALVSEPGTEYRPTQYGWVLASAAVEAAAGRPLLPFLEERVFRPLGMRDTGAESAKEENPEGVGEDGEDAPPFALVRHLVLKPLGVAAGKTRAESAPATVYARGMGPEPNVRYGLHVRYPGNLSCYAGGMRFYSTAPDLVRFGLGMQGGRVLRAETVQALPTGQRLGELRGQTVASLLMLRERGMVVAVMANADTDVVGLAREVAEAFGRR